MSSSQTLPSDLHSDHTPPIVGIVGGIGSGKSSVVKLVTDLRLVVIDADRIGHHILTVGGVRDELVRAFGPSILNNEGQIDRKKLATIVFGDSPLQSSNRSRLNHVVHPRIRSEIWRQIEAAPRDVDAIILDAAVLLESGWGPECDAVVFIDTPLEHRQKRVLENRNWGPDELQRREDSQWSLEKKRSFSQYVVNNSATPESAAIEMTAVLNKVIQSGKR